VHDDEVPSDYPEQVDHQGEQVLTGDAKRRKAAAIRYAQDVARAHETMEWLRKQLAPDGRCQNPKCGKRPREHSLTIHHVDGRDWEPKKLNRWSRAKRYKTEYLAGVRMQALCMQCNAGIHPDGDVKRARNIMNGRTRSRAA
jgi:hypothetical protein